MRLGFACEWEIPRERTWSHTPYSLFEALKRTGGVELTDIDGRLPGPLLSLTKLLSLRYSSRTGRLGSQYMFSSLHGAFVRRRMARQLHSASPVDAVVCCSDDLYDCPVPQYIYFDLCVAELQRVLRHPLVGGYERSVYSQRMIDKRIRYQASLYRSCAGLFAMSEYAARTAIEAYGLDARKVHVVHAGSNAERSGRSTSPHPREYILFVGRDFHRKGGELVVEAMRFVRRQVDIDLVVAGPPASVLPSPPEGVHMLGDCSRDVVSHYFRHARLFAMPSFFEAFGIAFAEALCNGVPVIARDSCAMSELVKHGENGYLLGEDSTSPEELGTLMLDALRNERMHEVTRSQMSSAQAYYSWDRVAEQMSGVIERDLSVV